MEKTKEQKIIGKIGCLNILAGYATGVAVLFGMTMKIAILGGMAIFLGIFMCSVSEWGHFEKDN